MDSGASYEHMAFLRGVKRRSSLILTTQVLIFVVFFGAWELFARLGAIDPFIFSKPTSVAMAALGMIKTNSLWLHIGVTLGETILGFALSTAIGTLIAIGLWLSEFMRRALNPYLVVLNALPKTALAPIIITAVGYNVRSVIFTAVSTSVIVTVLTVLTGFLEVSGEKIKVARTFGASKWQILRMVVLPASMPSIFNALEINVGLSFVGVIVGELIVAKAGLGYMNVYSQQTFKMDRVMLSVILLGLLSALMYKAVAALKKRFLMQ